MSIVAHKSKNLTIAFILGGVTATFTAVISN